MDVAEYLSSNITLLIITLEGELFDLDNAQGIFTSLADVSKESGFLLEVNMYETYRFQRLTGSYSNGELTLDYSYEHEDEKLSNGRNPVIV